MSTSALTESNSKNSTVALGAIALLAVGAAAMVGLMSFNPAWIAGSLGISAAAATQIVAAIKAGRSAATVIAGVAGAGVASALTATITWIVFNWATEVAVA